MDQQVFVKVEKYKEISEMITEIRSKLNQAKEVVDKIEQIRTEEDTQVASWKEELASAESRIQSVEATLSK